MKSKEIPRAQQTFTPLIISVFFIHPRSLLSQPKEHHCMQNDSNVKWTQYAAHTFRCASVLNVSMHILIHKYCIGCSVVWCCSCFQLFPLSRLCLFSRLVRWSRKMLLMMWFDTSLLYAGLNMIPPLCSGRDFGQPIERSPGLLPMIYVCLKSYICHWSLNR